MRASNNSAGMFVTPPINETRIKSGKFGGGNLANDRVSEDSGGSMEVRSLDLGGLQSMACGDARVRLGNCMRGVMGVSKARVWCALGEAQRSRSSVCEARRCRALTRGALARARTRSDGRMGVVLRHHSIDPFEGVSSSNVFDVTKYGAIGDGKTDDSHAFLNAWASACSSTLSTSTLFVPKGKTFLLKPVTFHGPCKSTSVTVQFTDFQSLGEATSKAMVQHGGNANSQGNALVLLHFHLFCSVGDDCIAISKESSDIKIGGIQCGPGHGISIGSLGQSYSAATVERIHVYNVDFFGTMNGARIKTWQGGSGYARDITFENLMMVNVENPIVIDQYYCNGQQGSCRNHTSAVKVSNVSFTGVFGSSSNVVAIRLACSQTVKCKNVHLKNIRLTSSVGEKKAALAYCLSVEGTSSPPVVPAVPCLSKWIN
ncbi:hypothetical protein Syun_016280 [Stephania yunnanensis]|uniref:Polygalacturonase n=1 Tax=Stephania yunnanensis TaxID=152371 RepID=A0AAP0J4W6_9MAGN